MVPKLKKRTQHTFDRIGDCYAPYVDREHFMGRSAFDDHWAKFNAPVNVRHDKDQCVIEIALPGFKKEEIDLFVDEDEIRIEAHRLNKVGEVSPVHKELVRDKINRSFSLPHHSDRTKISARFIDGVVNVVIPIRKTSDLRRIELE